ncbi:hypothetical protein [Gemmata sp.]|uniref:hypothetical protein n=1 Tax=Gemmata sp. TaxID=1914242 RepID=UPI003F712B2E
MAATKLQNATEATTDATREKLNAWLRRAIGEMQWLSRNVHDKSTPFASAFTEDEGQEIAFRISTSLDVLEHMLERFDLPEPPPEFADAA